MSLEYRSGDRIYYRGSGLLDDGLEFIGTIIEFREHEVVVLDDQGTEWRVEPKSLWDGSVRKVNA